MARKYARDNRGRFASKGSGATARGGRLKTASGNKRQSQTMQAKGGPKGTIGKPKGLKPGALKAKPAAKPAAKAGAKGRRQITAEKALRVSQRINNVTNAASSKTGVKRLNATEVGVRAKAFATRKVGGMSGTVGMNFQQQQAAVRSGLSKPPRYSTQKPNRNKPGAYNSLGQTEQRRRLRAADSIMRSSMATAGRAGNAGAADTARRIAASAQKSMAVRLAGVAPQQRLTTKSSGRKAPDNAKTRANRLRTMQNRVQYLRQEPDSPKFQKAAQARNAALQARSAGTPGKVVFRSKNRARSRQNMQANDITARVRYDLKNAGRGKFSATGGGGRTGVRRIDTGNRQPSLLGGNATKLYKTKRVSVNRASGKSRKFYR